MYIHHMKLQVNTRVRDNVKHSFEGNKGAETPHEIIL
jgi:hypothetical protein